MVGHGSVVGVVGDAGLGKSRLLAELAASPEGRAVRWAEGRSVAMGRTRAFFPGIVGDMVREGQFLLEIEEFQPELEEDDPRALLQEEPELLRLRASREQEIRLLSGGNQQKVILARWLAEPGLKVLILDEPTRGIDVGAKNEIYRIIHEVAERGCCVVVVSSELPEVLGIADRLIVMRDGRISGELTRAQANETEALRLALPDAAIH